MRTPATQSTHQWLHALADRRDQQARLQQQIASGLRLTRPSDDPAAAGSAELARTRLSQLAQQQRAAAVADGAMQAADVALTRGIETLQAARETLVTAGNAALGQTDRQALALQIRAARDELLQVADATGPTGAPVFGGPGWSGATTTGGATPAYLPAPGESLLGPEERWPVSLDGRPVFMQVPQGNGTFITAASASNTGAGWIDPGDVVDPTRLTAHSYTITLGNAGGALTCTVQDVTLGTTVASGVPWHEGAAIEIDGQRVRISGTPAAGDSFTVTPAGMQSVFETLNNALALLEGSPTTAGWNGGLQRVQADLDRALDSFNLARTRSGESIRSLEADTDELARGELATQTRRGALRDLDLAAAISELQAAQTVSEAALRTFASRQRGTLFDLLG